MENWNDGKDVNRSSDSGLALVSVTVITGNNSEKSFESSAKKSQSKAINEFAMRFRQKI